MTGIEVEAVVAMAVRAGWKVEKKALKSSRREWKK